MNSSIGSILYYSVKSSRDLRIFVRIIIGKMNKKEIQSFSLATLLDICGRRPEDLYYDGCLIASRVNVKDEFNIDLFRYPTRLDALAIIFCSKGSIVSTSGVTRHTIGERTLFVHLPGSILQVESVEDASVHAILCEKEFIQRINIDLKLLTQLFLQVEKHPSLPLDDEEWDGVMRSLDGIRIEGARQHNDPYSAEIIRSMIRTLAYKVCRIIARHVETGASEATSRSRNEEYFNQFMGVLTRHYMQQRSVGFYAEQLNLTPKYLTTIIRKTSGRTAVQWIDDYVVLEVKNLLKYSTMSIQEISYYLNFPNQSFFGKYFKNHTGMTPTAYRLGK